MTPQADSRSAGPARKSGVLLHVTSIPSEYGIGDLGPRSHEFARRLGEAGQSYWQMLPVTPTGYADSPYQSPSAFAGNPMLVSPEVLIELGLVADVSQLEKFPPGQVDYHGLIRPKSTLLGEAARAFRLPGSRGLTGRYGDFCEIHGPIWLDEAALFTAIKGAHDGVTWNEWPAELARRDPSAVAMARELLADAIETYRIIQFLFFEQWAALREAAHGHGIRLVGDLPLYVAHDSADVWANPGQFLLDENGRQTVVAGVPPDYFSETGQRWGNPIYDWDRMAAGGFSWWQRRMEHLLALFDVVRIDHFRGIAGYWAIPADEPTAVRGEWREGPGSALLDAIGIKPGHRGIVAEDLGVITPDVIALRDGYGLPGMRVAQFGFDEAPDQTLHHPGSYAPSMWAYSGTHDNNTTEGWFWEGNPTHDPTELDENRRMLYDEVGEPVSWGLVEMVAFSAAGTVIFPVQDLLGLGSEARMNLPGTTEHNWTWRLTSGELTDEALGSLADLTETTGRTRVSQ